MQGLDRTHVNEFTTMELYREGWDYEQLMGFTEELFRHLVLLLHPSGVVNGVDFTRPFVRLPIMAAINERCGSSLPDGITEEHRPQLLELCARHGIAGVDASTTLGRLIDKLVGHLVEPHCVRMGVVRGVAVVSAALRRCNRRS